MYMKREKRDRERQRKKERQKNKPNKRQKDRANWLFVCCIFEAYASIGVPA